MASPSNIVVTNYERLRDNNFDFSGFTAVWLDEGNYVKNMASLTTNVLKEELAKVRFKFIATATPSPNEVLELVNYAHVLGICDRGQILTRFFQRNSTKAGELTLHPQHEADFWLWVSSWCIAITSPEDLGYIYPGFQFGNCSKELAHPHSSGFEAIGDDGFQIETYHTGIIDTGTVNKWPSRPGEQQYPWEEPRTIKPGLGCTIDGYNFREDLLRAYGNIVVEQTAELAFRTLMKKHFTDDNI